MEDTNINISLFGSSARYSEEISDSLENINQKKNSFKVIKLKNQSSQIKKANQKIADDTPQTNRTHLNNLYKKIYKMTKVQKAKAKIFNREEYERQEKQKYCFDYVLIPSKNATLPSNLSYFLCGGVFIEYYPDKKQTENVGPSILNDFVQVLGTEIYEEKGIVEVKLQNIHSTLSDFQCISESLAKLKKQSESSPSCNLNNFFEQNVYDGENIKMELDNEEAQHIILEKEIEKYGHFIQQLTERKEAFKCVKDYAQFSEIVSNQSNKFSKFVEDKISKISERQPILTYRIYKFDLNDFQFKLKSHGYSEEFTKVIGYSSLNYFKERVMHQGLPEIYTNFTRQTLALAQMRAFSNKLATQESLRCRLQSLDGIEVDTTLNINFYPFYDTKTPIFNSLFDYPAILEVSEYNIQRPILKQLIEIRKKLNFNMNEALKQDIYYELQSQGFIDKFYSFQPFKIKRQDHSKQDSNATSSNHNLYASTHQTLSENDSCSLSNIQSQNLTSRCNYRVLN